MDQTTPSSSAALHTQSVKRKSPNWGGSRLNSGRKKKQKITNQSPLAMPTPALAPALVPSTAYPLTVPGTSFPQPTASVTSSGFFAPRLNLSHGSESAAMRPTLSNAPSDANLVTAGTGISVRNSDWAQHSEPQVENGASRIYKRSDNVLTLCLICYCSCSFTFAPYDSRVYSTRRGPCIH
jgi:hypothetical protein